MDEAVQLGIKGVSDRVEQLCSEMVEFRNEFRGHVVEDRAIADQVKEWAGAMRILIWLAVTATSVLVAHVAKHW